MSGTARSILITCSLLWSLGLAACGGDDAPSDAGPDVGVDASPDAGPDSGVDGGPDAGDADSGIDAGGDAGADAAVDAGGDAGVETCGDGVITASEACDDGATADGDGCSSLCAIEQGWSCAGEPSLCDSECGDGLIVGQEVCDDMNTDANDGCSILCDVELGFACTGEPSACSTTCGDRIPAGLEECDDGNVGAGDGCSDVCSTELGYTCSSTVTGGVSSCETVCSDGLIAGLEECDDMNLSANDGCGVDCTIDYGFVCGGEPSSCGTVCSDGLVAGTEQCDDTNTTDGDGCSAVCATELGYTCTSTPSACSPVCGDGLIIAPEACDDLNTTDTDGCDSTCQIEPGYVCTGEPSTCLIRGDPVQVALGDLHGCLRTSTGLLFCFGQNDQGPLGIGTIDEPREPTLVPGISNVIDVGTGQDFSCALRGDGTVACWGDNPDLQIGPGGGATSDNSLSPIDVTGLNGVAEIAVGADFACARLAADGAVWCWGDNDNRQLGRGGTATTDSATPSPVLNADFTAFVGAVAISAGADHACALMADTSVMCWGDNDNRQNGNGTTVTTDVSNPSTVLTSTGTLTNVVALSLGGDEGCAVIGTGEVYCWGDNDNGQLGNASGTTTDSSLAAPVVGLNGATRIGVGENYACAVVGGGVRCWGRNLDGELGDGTQAASGVPVDALGLSNIVSIRAGDTTVCALTATGARYCWGENEMGELGLSDVADVVVPTVMPGLTGVTQISGSTANFRGHACARTGSSELYCWGNNDQGQLGFTGGLQTSPVLVAGASDVQAVACSSGSTANDSTCAIVTGGQVVCFGANDNGQLGDNTLIDRPDPQPVATSTPATQIVAGDQFYCALHTDGRVRCWGADDNGQFGQGATAARRQVPVEVPAPIINPLQIAAGSDHVCAVMATGELYCWGDNDNGQLGNGNNPTDSPVPNLVPGVSNVAQVVAGADHTCVRDNVGAVSCWGNGLYGNLGAGNTADSPTPVVVPVTGATFLSSGNNFVCMLDQAGDATCWGYALRGHLGTGSGVQNQTNPMPVPGISGAVFVEGVNATTFWVNAAGDVRAMGFIGPGQIGLAGRSINQVVPVLAPF